VRLGKTPTLLVAVPTADAVTLAEAAALIAATTCWTVLDTMPLASVARLTTMSSPLSVAARAWFLGLRIAQRDRHVVAAGAARQRLHLEKRIGPGGERELSLAVRAAGQAGLGEDATTGLTLVVLI